MRFLKKILLFPLLCLLAGCVSTRFGERPEVQAFIYKVSAKDNFNAQQLTTLFNQVHPRPVIIHHARKPAETEMTWPRYRAIFLTQSRIAKGVAFWNAHAATLQQAQQEYGVDSKIIVGILGVETEYGKYLGKYRVIDSLSTLAFNHSYRSIFFQQELEQYLLLTRDLNVNPLSVYGSYAGAVGLPQFMPDSYRQLAVSKNGQMPDLWHNPDDAILSIAHYFHYKGWQAHQKIAVRLPHATPYTVQFGEEHWLLYPNFKVIKRYNDSNFYALTVYQLGEAIQQEREYQR